MTSAVPLTVLAPQNSLSRQCLLDVPFKSAPRVARLQVLLSHTPFKELVPRLHDKPVLLSGRHDQLPMAPWGWGGGGGGGQVLNADIALTLVAKALRHMHRTPEYRSDATADEIQ
jgi:hypothetical protein